MAWRNATWCYDYFFYNSTVKQLTNKYNFTVYFIIYFIYEGHIVPFYNLMLLSLTFQQLISLFVIASLLMLFGGENTSYHEIFCPEDWLTIVNYLLLTPKTAFMEKI